MKPLILTALGLAFTSLAFTSCAHTEKGTVAGGYLKFKAREDYRTTMTVYQNAAAYSMADPGNTRIRIDLSDQRAQLLVGAEEKVAIDTPVSTGRDSKPTPPGVYPVTEKIVNKRSTIFGTTYYRGRRVHGGDRRQYRGRRDQYVGAPLPYWMRMTSCGIGMHGSSGVHRHPASSGCVRTPQSIIPQIFAKVKKGTSIEVVR